MPWLTASNDFSNKVLILVVINVIMLFVGMIMDTTPAIMILTPILLPVATAFGACSRAKTALSPIVPSNPLNTAGTDSAFSSLRL